MQTIKQYPAYYALLAVVALVAAILVGVAVATLTNAPIAKAGGSNYGSICDTATGAKKGSTNATTSLQFLPIVGATGDSATSTLGICNTGLASAIALNWYTVSSTTPTGALLWTVQYSYNAQDWYNEDTNSTSGSLVTHQATTTHTWSPGQNGTTTKSVWMQNITAPFIRILYSSTATTTIYGQIIPKNTLVN